MDWFERLMGFAETDYEVTRSRMEVVGGRLRSLVNGNEFSTGQLETPSLKELRQRAESVGADRPRRSARPLRVTCVSADVGQLHRDPAHRGALFQVASQFNLLEMIGPEITPEHGVTRYGTDHTQGPACSIAAGAATIYRNYFAQAGGGSGQRHDRQVDCLRDIGTALGNDGEALWTMRNGYALCSEQGLNAIDRLLARDGGQHRSELRDLLRIGLHWNVEVTAGAKIVSVVSQAFCSALPVSYSPLPIKRWEVFATLVLEGAYEATIWAALLNAQRTGCDVVFLTMLGGGAFGNERAWILAALLRALDIADGSGLDVRLVSYATPSADILEALQRYR